MRNTTWANIYSSYTMATVGLHHINNISSSTMLGYTTPPSSNILSSSSELVQSDNRLTKLLELPKVKQVRERTFSKWPEGTSPSKTEMIQAGFFSCNVGDRVICIYCNLICQQWTPNTADPIAVHKAMSPKCVYVVAMLALQRTISRLSINEAEEDGINGTHQLHVAEQAMITPIDWLPHRAYMQQLCIAQYHQSFVGVARFMHQNHGFDLECNEFNNPSVLSKAVEDRLDLPVSTKLVAQGFDRSIIKSCYENQLKQVGKTE